jgi:hypothetical protein
VELLELLPWEDVPELGHVPEEDEALLLEHWIKTVTGWQRYQQVHYDMEGDYPELDWESLWDEVWRSTREGGRRRTYTERITEPPPPGLGHWYLTPADDLFGLETPYWFLETGDHKMGCLLRQAPKEV